MAAVDSAPAFTQPKVVEKVFSLPIVSDSYSYGVDTVSSLTYALHPHLSSSLASLPPLLSSHLSSLQALGEDRLPGMVTAKLKTARDQVTAGVQYLDSTLCDGLDQLLVKVPALKSPTPALYSSTREAAVCQLALATTYLATITTLVTTYLASFPLAQLALKISKTGLETADSLLKLVPASYSSLFEPIVSGLKTVRSQAEHLGEGARVNGSQKVASLESSSLLSAVSEVFGLNYVLDILGLAEVFAKAGAPGEVVKEDVPEKVEPAVKVVKEDVPEKIEADIVEVVKEVVKGNVEASVDVVEQVVLGAVTAQKEGKKGYKSLKN